LEILPYGEARRSGLEETLNVTWTDLYQGDAVPGGITNLKWMADVRLKRARGAV